MRMVLPQFDLTRSNFFQYQKLVYKTERDSEKRCGNDDVEDFL